MDAPFTTGNEILNYHGDANLGVGSGEASTPEAFNFQPLQGVLGQMQDREATNHLLKYKQKVEEQDNLAKMLAGQDGGVFNMKDPSTGKDMSFAPLPDDQKILTEKAHDLRKTVLENPGGYKYDQGYLDKLSEFKNLQRQASLRAVHVAKEQQDMQGYDSESDRQDARQHLDSEVFQKSLTDYHRPEPYLPSIKTDINKVYPDEKSLMETSEKIVSDGGVDYKVQESRPAPDKLDIRPSIIKGTPQFKDASNIVLAFLKDPASKDPQALMQHNKEVEAANQRMGFTPDNPHYIPPIPLDPNTGQIDPEFAKSPSSTQDLFYSLSAPQKAVVKTARAVSDAAIKQNKERASIDKEKAQAGKVQYEIEHLKAQTEQAKAAAKKLDGEAKKIADGETAKTAEINSSVSDVLSHMSDVRVKSKFTTVDDYVGAHPESKPFVSTIKESGLNPQEYDIAKIDPHDQKVINIAGIQSQKPDGTFEQGAAKIPEAAYYLKSKTGNPKDDRYFVAYQSTRQAKNDKGVLLTDENTKKPKYEAGVSWKVISPKDAIENNVKTKKNFTNISDKTTETISKAQSKIDEIFNNVTGAPKKQTTTRDTRPKSVPAHATWRGDKGFWVDKINKKVYNKDGQEVIPQ